MGSLYRNLVGDEGLGLLCFLDAQKFKPSDPRSCDIDPTSAKLFRDHLLMGDWMRTINGVGSTLLAAMEDGHRIPLRVREINGIDWTQAHGEGVIKDLIELSQRIPSRAREINGIDWTQVHGEGVVKDLIELSQESEDKNEDKDELA